MAVRRASITLELRQEELQELQKPKLEQGEAMFNFKEQKMQTDMEMWLMEALPQLYGVADCEELPDEDLHEEGQAATIQAVCAAATLEDIQAILLKWLSGSPDQARKEDFIGKMASLALKVKCAGRVKGKAP